MILKQEVMALAAELQLQAHVVEKDYVRQMDRAADAHHGRMRDAWKLVPGWAQRGSGVIL